MMILTLMCGAVLGLVCATLGCAVFGLGLWHAVGLYLGLSLTVTLLGASLMLAKHSERARPVLARAR